MDLEKKSIERIKMASEMSLHRYGKPLVCTYSGGKDSDVMLELFKRSGVKFEVVNNHTTVDAPPTVYHIREQFRRLEECGIKATINKPKKTMWELIEKNKYPPTRIHRYCCVALKESRNKGRMVATGVRWAESIKRSGRGILENVTKEKSKRIILMNDNDDKRKMMERCEIKGEVVLNPIIDWPDNVIWEYYWDECSLHNPLYDMGYYRIGCIGCPMAGKNRWKEFTDFPTYKRAYMRSFDRMLEAIYAAGKVTKWKSGYDVFLWWMEDKNIEGQMSLEDFMEY